MPKQVDHDERRREIGDAVCRVIAARGLDTVSLRHVAAETGVSMGRVQHYFATKDEMLMFAFDLISERVEARLGAVHSDDPATYLRAILLELLPLSPAARAEAPVLAAFLAQAVVEPRFAEVLRRGNDEMVVWLAGLIAAVRPGGDPKRDAAALLAFADGLMLQVLIGQVSPEAAEELVDHQLSLVLTRSRHTGSGTRSDSSPARA
ncbi:TetR/AcrR family transcriptional regulator [Lentzea flava]|uniref:HTH-type transcriptional regulator PksA n=1 Tax=Lentzea flava TaxID=103732 RepID=A0ABQ2UKH5_9PSEU|nr:TetR/AcrR family transcriptional regulator [Lentzea flava]MCP2200468.1 transcriptional regulator, TetR family [Lentzea flava]GGU42376.1 HTH-type transcriptional regulator PksA [Lentzea flava]